MLGLRELVALNVTFYRRPPERRSVQRIAYIIMVCGRGRKASFYDPRGYFMGDGSKVSGWSEGEFTIATQRARQLKETLHIDDIVTVTTPQRITCL